MRGAGQVGGGDYNSWGGLGKTEEKKAIRHQRETKKKGMMMENAP